METNVFSTFGIHFRREHERWCALIQALNARQAVEVLCCAAMEGSALLAPCKRPFELEAVEELGLPEELPFPEVLPDGPALLSVVRVEGKQV